MDTKERVLRNRVRRIAERQGLAVHVSRRRDPHARDYGEVMLRWLDAPNPDSSNEAWVGPFSSIEDVELVLTTDPKDYDELPPRIFNVDNIEKYFAAGEE